MNKLKEAIKVIWTRLTSSKVAWMALPAGLGQLWLALMGDDVSGQLNAVFAAIWAVLALFLSVNNPTDSEHF